MKLADALLRRKELQEKVNQLRQVKEGHLFEVVVQRRQINDTVDDISAKVPKVSLSEVTKEYDSYASKLRRIDAAIQQLNWTMDINAEVDVWNNYEG